MCFSCPMSLRGLLRQRRLDLVEVSESCCTSIMNKLLRVGRGGLFAKE